MVVFDWDRNGWRWFILPLAESNDVVRDAVLAVSASHLAQKSPGLAPKAKILRGAAIQSVILRSRNLYQNIAPDPPLIAALMLLVLDDMVSGGDEFPFIFKMLRCLLQMLGGEDTLSTSEFGVFLLQHYRYLEFVTLPTLTEAEAVAAITTRFHHYLDFLINPFLGDKTDPLCPSVASMLINCFSQASSIYVCRALSGPSAPLSGPAIEQLKATVEAIPPGSAGEHLLAWVFFVAAAESSSAEHRQFFKKRLKGLYDHGCSGFGNIWPALVLLENMWQRSDQSWTSMLAGESRVLIA
ncbi:hypothetical protein H2201_002307 [Coniosporium apollinis]|uniref:Acriflavine sensitivity control protein acr-2 n=2 Tax=Coniosporium TaxID=2810619 RepID=A0ABQ9NYI0_9PEZI|nr:hypothetical protein H2199_001931 [Cladosporium sp. JES 115]KAJ9667439.1 hypothetical protein H2201_002307 [Coniosporium apollinis]